MYLCSGFQSITKRGQRLIPLRTGGTAGPRAACSRALPCTRCANSRRKKNPLKIQWVSCMAHSGGFEPPTARFVAEYSIQLSYECVVGAYYRAFYLTVNLFFLFNSRNYLLTTLQYKSGGEGGIRTLDTLLRCTPLAGERLRPLGHLSVTRAEY